MISFNVKIEEGDHEELARLALLSERTIAAEIRVAVKRHINMERLTEERRAEEARK